MYILKITKLLKYRVKYVSLLSQHPSVADSEMSCVYLSSFFFSFYTNGNMILCFSP